MNLNGQLLSHTQNLKQYWGKKSSTELGREEYDPRKKIHTDLLWKEIYHLIGNRQNVKILDAGAGPGRFSIPLSQQGHQVTHLDISQEMITIARQRAVKSNISSIKFLHQSICEKMNFPDNSFDIVLCLDSPLSYCVTNYEQTFEELLRVSKEFLLLCVVNKLGAMLEDGGSFDLTYFGKLTTLKSILETGNLIVDENLLRFQPSLMPSWHGFTVAEIKNLTQSHHCKILKLMAPGTFARFMDPELLKQLYNKPMEYEEFLSFIEEFDQIPEILGVGAINAGGLLVSIKKSKSQKPNN